MELLYIFAILALASSVRGQFARPGESCSGVKCLGEDEGAAFCEPVWGFYFCACTPGYFDLRGLHGRECVPPRHKTGEDCIHSDQCNVLGLLGPLSECRLFEDDSGRGTCECIESAVHEPTCGFERCRLISNSTGAPCEVNSQCQATLGDLSKCTGEGTCACLEEENLSIPTFDGGKCLPVRGYLGMTCEFDDQCRRGTPGEFSKCDGAKKVCVCQDDATNERGENVCHKI